MEQPDALQEADGDDFIIQDDASSDEEEDALESLIQHELSKFQQQQAVKYAELAASGWVALPLPSPAPVQQLLRAEEHQLETEPSGHADPCWQQEERIEYTPAARHEEHCLQHSPEHQQQQQQQRLESPFGTANLGSQGFARPWSAAEPDNDDVDAVADGEAACSAAEPAEAAMQQGFLFEPTAEQDVDTTAAEAAEQQLSEEQYEFDADSEANDSMRVAVGGIEQLQSQGSAALIAADEDSPLQQQQQAEEVLIDADEPAVYAEDAALDGAASSSGGLVQLQQQPVDRTSSAGALHEDDAEEQQQQDSVPAELAAAATPEEVEQQQQQPTPCQQHSMQATASLTGQGVEEGETPAEHWMELPIMQLQPTAAATAGGRDEAAVNSSDDDLLSVGTLAGAVAAQITPALATAHRDTLQPAEPATHNAPQAARHVDAAEAAAEIVAPADQDTLQPAILKVHTLTHAGDAAEAVVGELAALSIQGAGGSSSSNISQVVLTADSVRSMQPCMNCIAGDSQAASAASAALAVPAAACCAASSAEGDLGPSSLVVPAAAAAGEATAEHQEQHLMLQQQGAEAAAVCTYAACDGEEQQEVEGYVCNVEDDDGFVYQDDGEDSSCCSTPPADAAAVLAPEAAPAEAAPGKAELKSSSSTSSSPAAPPPAAAATVHSTALGLRSLSLRGRRNSSTAEPKQPQQQQQQQQQELWQPAEGITGWQTDDVPAWTGGNCSSTACINSYGQCLPAAEPMQVISSAGRVGSSEGDVHLAAGSLPYHHQQQQQQQQQFHQRVDRPVHSRNRPAGAGSPLLDAAKAWKASSPVHQLALPSSSVYGISTAAMSGQPLLQCTTPGRSVSAGRGMVANRVRPGSAPCRQSFSPQGDVRGLQATKGYNGNLLSSIGCSTGRTWVPGGATATQQQLLQAYGQQGPAAAAARGGSGGWGISAAAGAAKGSREGLRSTSSSRPSTASPVRRPPWQQLSAGCNSANAAAAAGRREGGLVILEQQQQQVVYRLRPCSADALRVKAIGPRLQHGIRPGSSSSSRDLRGRQQQLAEDAIDAIGSATGVECWCDGELVGGLIGDSRRGQQQQQQQQRAWDDSPIPLNVPKSMPLADSTQDAGLQLAARANGRCVSASRSVYGYAAGSGAAAAGRPRSAGAAAALQNEAAWEAAAAAGGAGNSSSSTNVYLTETLQKLKQANSCCRKLGLVRQYALAPCSKPRWQLQHIAVKVWQCCATQLEQQQQNDAGNSWQVKSSLTLGQFNRQLEKLQAKVASTAAAAAAQAAAGAGGSGSNCSSLFGSPAGSRQGSPARTRPCSANSTRPSPAHAGESGSWCSPGAMRIAVPEASCRTSSRLSPRRQQQQQGKASGCAASAVGSQTSTVAPAGHQSPAAAVVGSANAAGGLAGIGAAARGGGMLPYAVPAWLEEHL